MCHFVFVGLPANAQLEDVRPIAARLSRPLSEQSWAASGPGAPTGISLFHTCKHCDCGTAIGAGSDREQPWRPSDTQLKKLRRKGWSETKIGRWVEENRKAQARREAEEAELESRSLPEVEDWLALAAQSIQSSATPRFCLLLAWSPGETVNITNEVRIPISEASPQVLYQAEENVLYTFTRA